MQSDQIRVKVQVMLYNSIQVISGVIREWRCKGRNVMNGAQKDRDLCKI